MEVMAAEREKRVVAKAQATYAKRRSNLLRKANEISIFCDVDIAVVAFSPAGRISKFCNKERLEEIIERYINVEPEKRYPHIGCLEWKLHKIKHLDHIRGDENKLSHFDTQIKNLELQIKKSTLELGILHSQLKDYEPENGNNDSLAEILHCEKKLKDTLQVIMDRRISLANVESNSSLGQTRLRTQGQAPLAYETYPSFGQKGLREVKMVMQERQTQAPLAYRYPNGASSSHAFPNGASSSYSFNPVAAGYPAIYHPGYSYLTPQTEIPPTYPPIKYQPFYWDLALASAPNWHLGVYGNPSMHQAICPNPAVPLVPYQQMGAWGTPDLYRPIMPGIVDQHLGGLRSSSAQQMMRQDHITPGIPNQQSGALGGSFLNQSLMGDGMAPYVQFQQPRVLGNPYGGRLANDKSSRPQENPTPIYHDYTISNTQNDATPQPVISQLHQVGQNVTTSQPAISQLHEVDPDLVNLLVSPTLNTTQNMDVTPTLNSERVCSEAFSTNDIGSITNPTAGNGDNINNTGNGGIENSSGNYCKDVIGIPDGPTDQEIPPPASPTDSFFLDFLLDEAAMENDKPQTADNQVDDFMEWDGFALAENLNFEDLDIVF